MKNEKKHLFAFVFVLLYAVTGGFAQEFGFGFDNDGGTSDSAPPVSVVVGGELAAEFSGYVYDFSSAEKAKDASLGDVISGALNVRAGGTNAEAFIGFNLSAATVNDLVNYDSESVYAPLILDEAYVRAFIGPVNIEAGLRKLTWGKADSLGPLDIVNPMDYTDLRNMIDIQSVKIARPMAHISWNTNGFSKLEAVFIPGFAGHRFAQDKEDRWAPAQYREMFSRVEGGIFSLVDTPQYGDILSNPLIANRINTLFDGVRGNMIGHFDNITFPPTDKLEYFQTGLRFTTTIGPADIGAQYFYGSLFEPDVTIAGIDGFLDNLIQGNLLYIMTGSGGPDFGDPELVSVKIKYNRYHQMGLDYAQVLAGFNVRAEFAVHLTEDMSGEDGSVRNPFIGWSLGFDRDLFWGINANVQCNEIIRLMHDKVGSNPVLDCEADTKLTSTRITMRFSKKFLRDELESTATVIWGIEDMDCYIIPGIVWTIGDFSTELSAGIFAGDKSGELGQYWENSFIKLGLKYSF
jgi:hypothetical protein